jgi:hypothetical protein
MQNTYTDLRDCFENWEDTSSDTELKYRDRILALAKKIVAMYGEGNLS